MEESRVYIEESRVCIEESRVYIEESRVYIEESRVYIEESRVYIEESRVYIEESRVYIEESRVCIEESRVYIGALGIACVHWGMGESCVTFGHGYVLVHSEYWDIIKLCLSVRDQLSLLISIDNFSISPFCRYALVSPRKCSVFHIAEYFCFTN
ncbi:hypothetical protein BOX15_Mlig027206g1 [Macrostomum lignano]|uniref:Uncharacterized protein n=1 Tax=Macrostomum lignano TaxID=282301 RepID=A0A267GN66_9PLAT|nr:hypothetical protein BOX15_Mlig027206g1 [Macrostomum lignano]